MALPHPYGTSFAGHFHADVATESQLEEFLETAVSGVVGPSGAPAAAEIGPAGDEVIVLEFVLLDDRAFLRHGRDIAVEPGFFHESGLDLASFARDGTRRIHNVYDEVEDLQPSQLLCRPQWVRDQIRRYAVTGVIPDGIAWARRVEPSAKPSKASGANWRWHGGWRTS